MEFEVTTRQKTLWALLLFAACCVVYANGTFGAFTYDDKAIVRDNPRIRSPRNVRQIFTTSYFGGPRGTGSAYRPLLLLSYAGQWWIHGKDVVAFHVVNVLFHAVATLLLAALLLRLGLPPPSAAAAAVLFAVHPIHVEAVTSLVGRGETQAAVFVLLYLHLALALWRANGERRRANGETRFLLPLLLASLCYAAALLTKESSAIAPALAFLLLLYCGEGTPFRRFSTAVSRMWPLWLLSAGVLAGTFRLRSWVLGGPLRARTSGVFEVENALAALPPLARAVNSCTIVFRSLGRCVCPLHLSADESAWSIRPLPSLSPLALAAAGLLVALLLASLARLPQRSPLALGFLFFAIALLPTANLLFPTGTIFAERLAYLPSVGACFILGCLLSKAVSASREAAPPAQELPLPPGEGRGEGETSVPIIVPALADAATVRYLPLLVVVLLFAGRTILRNAVWWTDEGLFANLIATSPDSAKAHYDVAYVAVANRRYPQALAEYSRAVSIYPRYWDAWAGRGRTLKEMGNLPEAKRSYEKAIAANPDYENGYFGLGGVLEAMGDDAEAEKAYRRGLERIPKSLPLAYRLALLESRTKRPAADREWKRALRLGANSAVVRADHARWLLQQGRADEAAREAREAWRRDPANLTALRLLAEKARAEGKTLAEELALERIYRLTRSPEDVPRLEELKRRNPDLSRRPPLPTPTRR